MHAWNEDKKLIYSWQEMWQYYRNTKEKYEVHAQHTIRETYTE